MKSYRITEEDYIKAVRKADREYEIAKHGKQISMGGRKIHKCANVYSRKNYKIEWSGDIY